MSGNVSNEIPNESTDSTLGSPVSDDKGTEVSDTKQGKEGKNVENQISAKEWNGHNDGYGLAKLVKYHPEVLDNLQEILDDIHVTRRSENRVQLESDTHQATVRLTWDNEKKNWLLTAFEKKNSALDNTTDTGKTSERGRRNDTATPQSTVSEGKGTETTDTTQGKEKKITR